MTTHYVRPYVSGSITEEGWVVVCVPGTKPVEVVAPLGNKIAEMLIRGDVKAARMMLHWFGDPEDEHEHE